MTAAVIVRQNAVCEAAIVVRMELHDKVHQRSDRRDINFGRSVIYEPLTRESIYLQGRLFSRCGPRISASSRSRSRHLACAEQEHIATTASIDW